MSPYNYYQWGDYLVAGVIPTRTAVYPTHTFRSHPSRDFFPLLERNFQHIFAILIAIEEINQNSLLLLNITLGYSIYENCFSTRTTYEATIDILSSSHGMVPNFKCGREDRPLAVIQGGGFETFFQMATMLSIYKVPQALLTHWTSKVLIYYGDLDTMLFLPLILSNIEEAKQTPLGKVWICTALWGFTLSTTFKYWDIKPFHGALTFTIQGNQRSKFHDLILIQDDSLESVWSEMFDFHDSKYRLSRKTWKRGLLHPFLKAVCFNTIIGEEVFFDEDGALVANYDIVNLVVFPNKSAVRKTVGKLETRISTGLAMSIQEEAIVWPSSFNQDAKCAAMIVSHAEKGQFLPKQ
ncbi:hypothetical protein E2320_014670, partial [Naja naja]